MSQPEVSGFAEGQLFNNRNQTTDFRTIVRSRDSLYFLDELVLGQGRLEGFDLVPLLGEQLPATLVDILKEKDFDVLCIKRFELLEKAVSYDAAETVWRGLKG